MIILNTPKKTNPEVELLANKLKDNNLLMSGGSDCHGEKKSNRKIGIGYGNLNISKDILSEWSNKN